MTPPSSSSGFSRPELLPGATDAIGPGGGPSLSGASADGRDAAWRLWTLGVTATSRSFVVVSFVTEPSSNVVLHVEHYCSENGDSPSTRPKPTEKS